MQRGQPATIIVAARKTEGGWGGCGGGRTSIGQTG